MYFIAWLFLISLDCQKIKITWHLIFLHITALIHQCERGKTNEINFPWLNVVFARDGFKDLSLLFSHLSVVMLMTSRCTIPMALLLCLTQYCHLNGSSHTPDAHENLEVQTWLDALCQRPASTLASMLKATLFETIINAHKKKNKKKSSFYFIVILTVQ